MFDERIRARTNARNRPGWERLEELASAYDKEGNRVLDVGIHGDARPGGHCYMFDRATYETADIDKWVLPTHVADIRELPMPNDTYDMIICHSTMEHVLERREEAYSELYRVLKPGGTLVYSIPVELTTEAEASSYVSPSQLHDAYRGKDYVLSRKGNSLWVEVCK